MRLVIASTVALITLASMALAQETPAQPTPGQSTPGQEPAGQAVSGQAVSGQAVSGQGAAGQEPAPDAGAPAPEAFVPSLPQDLAGVAGTWDLSRDGATRRCVMTLTTESGDAGRRLRFPAGCRRALPLTNTIAGWLFTDGAIRLVDKNVRPVLAFARRPDARSLGARSEAGESYSLVPLQIAAMRPPGEPPVLDEAAKGEAAKGEPGSAMGAAALEPSAGAPQPGIYALDRYAGQDVCRIALAPVEGAQAPARLLDGCQDSGIAVFDPVSWSYAAGRLTLKARRGHVVNLASTGDGRWRRDPDVGATFVLRRIDSEKP